MGGGEIFFSRPKFSISALPSWRGLESRSQTETMSARFEFKTPGISCPRAMRPQPIWPIRSRLLGAFGPSNSERMIVGNAINVATPVDGRIKSRRDTPDELGYGDFMGLNCCEGEQVSTAH